jgi:uncharacterized protein (UPF0332 family)
MILQKLQASGHLRPHRSSAEEVAGLMKLVERDLADAELPGLSSDRCFAIAYNAALQLATIALSATGYRAAGVGHHWATFQALPEVMGVHAQGGSDYLENCRRKRNTTEYDRPGEITENEAPEMLAEARAFHSDLLEWLRTHHPALLPKVV